jgi:hypothetical protein
VVLTEWVLRPVANSTLRAPRRAATRRTVGVLRRGAQRARKAYHIHLLWNLGCLKLARCERKARWGIVRDIHRLSGAARDRGRGRIPRKRGDDRKAWNVNVNNLTLSPPHVHNRATKLRPNNETVKTVLTRVGQGLAYEGYCLGELRRHALEQAKLRVLFIQNV